ncbi:EVE domain-containing protein [Cardiobacteriaceae bacterium TAE3-ERU3]|nr:EVE domain-containing protein [Cardiobacteriaceae bacterium TAE3-ERU3]
MQVAQPQYWLAVACAEHVTVGVAGGFMQVCHGKQAPLKRIKRGDKVVYYSPSVVMGKADGLQSFTAVGEVVNDHPYQVEMSAGFKPFRRDVCWQPFAPLAIRALLDELSFTRGRKNWGYMLRFGLLKIEEADWQCILSG